MGYGFEQGESVEHGLRRIAGEQLDDILNEVHDQATPLGERVHSARKRCKKIRGLLRLVRCAREVPYRRENAAVRDSSRLLSALRDSQTVLNTFDRMRSQAEGEPGGEAFDQIRDGLVRRQQALVGEGSDATERLAEFSDRIAAVRSRVDHWRVRGRERAAVSGGVKLTYARGRRAMAAALDEPTAERFHEWRKRVKDHWCHLLLLEAIWPPVLKSLSDQAKELADHLGNDHDLAVIGEQLSASPEEFGGKETVDAFIALTVEPRAQWQSQARELGRRLYLTKPRELAKQFRDLWRASIHAA